jgi:glycosyltransferase involved in cell wall biosynthesis
VASISVITVVRNHAHGLEKTLSSLLMQDFDDWECLIVIGESGDETYSVAREYSDRHKKISWMREQTKGIYGAMNDGILATQSKYLNFMNAGDQFAQSDSLRRLVEEIESNDFPMVVGSFVIDDEEKSRNTPKDEIFNKLDFAFNRNWGNHQSMLFKRMAPNYLYDSSYRIAADFDFVLRYLNSKSGKRINHLVARIESGGLSDTNLFEGYMEKYMIRKGFFHRDSHKIMNLLWTFAAISKRSLINCFQTIK